MIQIFDIKRKTKNLKNNDLKILEKYLSISNQKDEEDLKQYKTTKEGLSAKEAKERLAKDGKNIVIKEEKKSIIYFLFNSLKDEFIIILICLAIINFLLQDKLGSLIIFIIALISALIRFVQDYSIDKFNRKLKSSIYSTTTVLRNGQELEIKVDDVVKGDIVKLNAGAIIPADLKIIEAKDLFLNESVFTGESALVEKRAINQTKSKEIFAIENIALMGSSVVSGIGTGLVIETGFSTYLGTLGGEIETKKPVTNFNLGMKHISNLLIKYMVVVCIVVVIIDGVIKKNINEAILFALSVAVGITPSMLPMIVNVNLTKGSRSLAKKKTLVKKIESIQNIGAIDILCTDKTGTLTENKIILQKYIDAQGKENNSILEYAYLNSYYSTGIKNLVDKAILAYAIENKLTTLEEKYEKIDEIPFDYTRKKETIIVKKKEQYRVITKGALEEILSCCTKIKLGTKITDIDQNLKKVIEEKAKELANDGMQVIALSEKKEYSKENQTKDIESNMIFIGFVGFLDPAKKEVKNTLTKLSKIGIHTKILTGDNP